MSSASYEHLILIHDNSDLNINALAEKIKAINWSGNEVEVTTEHNAIHVTINGWNFEIGLNASEFVVEESQELVTEFASDHQLHEQIKSCKKRLELSGDQDFEMDYFNDFCLILEKIESFKEVYTFNPYEGFMNI